MKKNLEKLQKEMYKRKDALLIANQPYERHHRKKLRKEVAALLRQLNGARCPICLVQMTDITMAIDHDHSTNKIRGIICRLCNAGLGMFRDDPNNLQRAIGYLKLFNAQQAAQVIENKKVK